MILAAAVRVLEREGINMTIDQVAQEAGIAKGTVYLYFTSKNQLLQQMFLAGIDLLTQTLDQAGQTASSHSQRLTLMLTAHYQLVAGRSSMMHGLEAMEPGVLKDVQGELLQGILGARQKYIDVLEAGSKVGEFRPHQCEVVATGLLAMVHNLIMTSALFGAPPGEEHIIHQIINLVFHGIGNPENQAFKNTIVNPEGEPTCKV